MAKRVSKSQIGKTKVGRVLSFDRLKGYGFIRTSEGEDIFFSSYDVPNNIWKRISIGDYVEFIVGENSVNPVKPVVAKRLNIIKKMPRQLSVTMPNGEELMVRYISRFEKGSLIKDGYRKLYPDYPTESFDYVFVKTLEKVYVFNRHDSPVIIDGETDVDDFYRYLCDLLIDYDISRDY